MTAPTAPTAPTSNVSPALGTTPASTLAPGAPAGPPADPGVFHREIRFAVVMYGGVSLSIYMNGIAQELLRMVRATAPKDGDPLKGEFRREASHLTGSEAVYRQLGGALKARFVVDILSGTSAGGINALYLAKALVKDRSLDRLRNLWVDEGDVGKLLADGASNDDMPAGLLEAPPPSLLNGQRFYYQLLDALKQMDDEGPHAPPSSAPAAGAVARAPYVDEVDLFMTATDFRGVELPMQLFDKKIDEPVHRKLFHFRFCQPGERQPEADDFTDEVNPMLAFAARCTASFPAAFAPFKLEDIDPILRAHPGYRDQVAELGSASGKWKRFFEGYPAGYEKRFFVDGGYLDNKPFEAAVGALAERRNLHLRVDRRLMYIEPDPESARHDGEAPRPDALAAILAVATLPRVETIRAELDEIARRNRIIARASLLTEAVEKDARQRKAAVSALTPAGGAKAEMTGHEKPVQANRWSLQDLRDLIARHGLAYGGYHRLKVSRVTDWLADYLLRIWDATDADRPPPDTLREMVWAWRQKYRLDYTEDERRKWEELRAALDATNPTDAQKAQRLPFQDAELKKQPYQPPDLPPTENRLLADLDIAYRLRRLQFVRLKLRELLQDATSASVVMELGCAPLQSPADWMASRGALMDLQRGLQPVAEALAALAQGDVEAAPAAGAATGAPAAFAAKCAQLKQTPVQAVLAEILDQLCTLVTPELFRQSKACEDLLDPKRIQEPYARAAVQALRYLYDHYDDFDLVRFPMMYCLGTEELEPVQVMRVSADDTTLAGALGARKLAGVKLGHFGAFLDDRWRENDILWGRLDGAERIIRTLAGNTIAPQQLEEWLLQAYQAIFEEERGAAAARESSARPPAGAPVATPAAIVPPLPASVPATRQSIADHVKRYTRTEPLVPERSLALVSRSTAILGKMLRDVAEQRQVGQNALVAWAARLIRVVWALVELATPKSIGQAVLRYWASLIMLTGGILFGLGLLFNWKDESRIGLVVAVSAFLVILLGQALTRVASGQASRLGVGLAVLATAIGAAVAAGTAGHAGAPASAHGAFAMLDLELAHSAGRLHAVMAGCNDACPGDVATAIEWDFALIAGYVLLLGGISLLIRALAARVGWRPGARVAAVAAALTLVAGGADALENGGLLVSLGRTLWLAQAGMSMGGRVLAVVVPKATFGFAALKWGLLFLVVLLDAFALITSGVAVAAGAARQPRTRVFLGHGGRSPVWQEIKEWLQRMPHIEVEACDLAASERKARRAGDAALDRCRFALFVITSQDDQAHVGRFQRQLGLFQGRLGIAKAMVIKEERCATFTDADSGQVLEFPSGQVAGVLDDLRRVLDDQRITSARR